MSLESDIDRLYELPLEQFTAARNALAARLKAAGDVPGSARVKCLEKPNVSAWAVNQLYWHARVDFDALVAAGVQLRRAQERSLKGGAGDLRSASEAKERAVAAALRATVAQAEHGGVAIGAAIRLRVASTLEAIAIQGGTGATPPGRFTDDLPLPGFAALAALAPAGGGRGGPGPTATPGAASQRRDQDAARARAKDLERRARLDRARADLAAAESDARAAREAAAKAASAERDAETRANDARQAADEARARLTDAMTRATRAVEERQSAKRRAAEANASLEQAERALGAARDALARARA